MGMTGSSASTVDQRCALRCALTSRDLRRAERDRDKDKYKEKDKDQDKREKEREIPRKKVINKDGKIKIDIQRCKEREREREAQRARCIACELAAPRLVIRWVVGGGVRTTSPHARRGVGGALALGPSGRGAPRRHLRWSSQRYSRRQRRRSECRRPRGDECA